MNGTWWVGPNDLDDDQSKIISLPIDDSILITGPPGSGKTNLLLLRANYFFLSGLKNISIITFTRSLREFIASGATKYDFPISKVVTCREWQSDLLHQYGSHVRSTGDFENDRHLFLSAMESIVIKYKLSDIFDAILLDEAQDYTPGEIRIFASLTKRIFLVADERQKIYEGEEAIEEMRKCVKEVYLLQYHYRNGVNICRIADEIAKKWHGYRPLAETSNYDEKNNPSTVDCIKCKNIAEQVTIIMSRLRAQLIAYPNQLIGILCPKKDTMEIIWEIIKKSEHAGSAFLLHSSTGEAFPSDKNIIVSTFHTAKGLEFRSLHLVNCNELNKFSNNRRIVFTAVTRAKTSLSIYYSGSIHGYIDAAISSLKPSPTPPMLADLFGGSR